MYRRLSIFLYTLVLCSGVYLALVRPVSGQVASNSLQAEVLAETTDLLVNSETGLNWQLTAAGIDVCNFVESNPADVVLVIDVSSSMQEDGKLTAAKTAAARFLDIVRLDTTRVAVVAFSSSASVRQSLSQDKDTLKAVINRLSTLGGTDIGSGLDEAFTLLSESLNLGSPGYVILLSDGQSNHTAALNQAEKLKDARVRVFTVSLGRNADQDLMALLASDADDYYHAPSPDDLEAIYRKIGGQIGTAVATQIRIVTQVNPDIDLSAAELQPAGILNEHQITWEQPSLAAEETVTFQTQIHLVQAGVYPATLSTVITYLACGQELQTTILPSGPELSVIAPVTPTPVPTPTPTPLPIPPCTLDPLSNECVASIACLGPVALPCNSTGLPWWVCLLLLPLLLSALFYALKWRRGSSALPATGSSGPMRPDKPASPTNLSTPQPSPTPVPLSYARQTNAATPIHTLVVGLGGTGKGVLDSLLPALLETYAQQMPANVRLLSIDTDLPGNFDAVSFLQIPLSQEVDPYDKIQGRSLRRQALITHRQQIQNRLRSEINAFSLSSGKHLHIDLVASLAGTTGSGLLIDLAHLLRQTAAAAELSVTLHAFLLLPDTHTAHLKTTPEPLLQAAAAAAWSELDRFQFISDIPYPMYLDPVGHIQSTQQGRLFERCFLMGADRNKGPSFVGKPLQHTLYPAIADAIVTLLDPAVAEAWQETQQHVDTRIADKQQAQQQALYRSLGTYSYILPIDVIAEEAVLDLLQQLVDSYCQPVTLDITSQVATWLNSTTQSEIKPALWLETLARFVYLSSSERQSSISHWGHGLIELLAPAGYDDPSARQVRELAQLKVSAAMPTSKELRARDEGEDTRSRFLPQLEKVCMEWSQWIQTWGEACRLLQTNRFTQQLHAHLQTILIHNPDHLGNCGPTAALTVLEALFSLLQQNQNIVQQVLSEHTARTNEAHEALQKCRQQLNKVAQSTTNVRPTLVQALSLGLGLPALVTVVGGFLARWNPAFFWPSAIFSALGATAGVAWSYRALFTPSTLNQDQQEYRAAVETWLQTENERLLYQTAADLLTEMRLNVKEIMVSFQQWQQGIDGLSPILAKKRQNLAKQREAQEEIIVRHYLDNADLNRVLYHRYLPQDLLPQIRSRCHWVWDRDKARWQPILYDQQPVILPENISADLAVELYHLAQSLTLPLQQARLIDILPMHRSPEQAGAEISLNATPFILVQEQEQPDAEANRLICLAAYDQQAYPQAVLQWLQQTVVHHRTEQLVNHASFPHRVTALTTLSPLQNPGVPAWRSAQRAYTQIPINEQAALHIFPAESHAVRWEASLRQLRLPHHPFSPHIRLLLEHEPQQIAFWLAHILGWIVDAEKLEGRLSYRWWQLAQPGQTPLSLTQSTPEPPSLWSALFYFSVNLPQENWQTLTALLAKQIANPGQRRQLLTLLEQWLDKATDTPDQKDRELYLLRQLVLEDLMRRLDHYPPLLEWLVVDWLYPNALNKEQSTNE